MLHTTLTAPDREVVETRLAELWERTGDPALRQLSAGEPPRPGARIDREQDRSDWTSTCLMECFKNTGDQAVFALLFELNRASFHQAIQSRLRRAYHHIDIQDVLQEVFLNIHRYPHRFQSDRADAFRNWGHRIVRNTLLKFLKGETRLAQFQNLDEEQLQPEDTKTRAPDRAAIEAESAVVVDRAYLLYLQLYLLHYNRLSPKERRALALVEVDGVSYKDAAQDLGIRLENLKMVIFRGRRKIFRGLETSLGQLAEAGAAAGAEAARGVGPAAAATRDVVQDSSHN